jgi:hypothetical protein
MTPIVTILAVRATVAVAVAIGAFAVQSSSANAMGLRVKLACAGDYYTHCSANSPDSPATRQCMRNVGEALSHSCVDALVAEGEVSADEVARRRSALKSASR